jgi:hypothetical protein
MNAGSYKGNADDYWFIVGDVPPVFWAKETGTESVHEVLTLYVRLCKKWIEFASKSKAPPKRAEMTFRLSSSVVKPTPEAAELLRARIGAVEASLAGARVSCNKDGSTWPAEPPRPNLLISTAGLVGRISELEEAAMQILRAHKPVKLIRSSKLYRASELVTMFCIEGESYSGELDLYWLVVGEMPPMILPYAYFPAPTAALEEWGLRLLGWCKKVRRGEKRRMPHSVWNADASASIDLTSENVGYYTGLAEQGLEVLVPQWRRLDAEGIPFSAENGAFA